LLVYELYRLPKCTVQR